jgi:hypothetical protein
MKKCTYCGLENPDEAVMCSTCHTEFVALLKHSPSEPSGEHVISPAEQQFWERMSFKEFAVLMVKLQALWVLYPALVEMTYLPGYLSTFFPASRFDVLPPELKHTFYLALLRIALRVVVAVAAFCYAEQLLSLLVRGQVAKQPLNNSLQATAAAPASDD